MHSRCLCIARAQQTLAQSTAGRHAPVMRLPACICRRRACSHPGRRYSGTRRRHSGGTHLGGGGGGGGRGGRWKGGGAFATQNAHTRHHSSPAFAQQTAPAYKSGRAICADRFSEGEADVTH